MTYRFSARITVSLAALMLGSLISLPAYSTTQLIFTSEYGDTTLIGQRSRHFAERVQALSNDELEIILQSAGTSGLRSTDHSRAINNDTIQIANTLAGTLGSDDPIFMLSSLPFVTQDIAEAEQLYRMSRSAYDALFMENDQILLYAAPWPASGIWSRKALRSPEDLQSLSIRTYDRNGQRVLLNTGSAPKVMAWNDVLPGLENRSLDAVLTSAEAGLNVDYPAHMKYYTAIHYAMPLNMVHMGRARFETLKPQQQQAILQAAKEADLASWDAVRNSVINTYTTLSEQGVTVAAPARRALKDALVEASENVITSWRLKAGATGRRILDDYMQQR
ncbi:TRAP transporter substrate-binding protein DctP [Cobetia sp. QF-1]|uniref:TRAP transporter substrate-binding protein DctP n=1 Tax=Cobetia sp. QF-1 TaxID=1969833 RepID=UPI000B53F01E|nr:TRAP transporter substrate-binding protein DctP [Cobetia sp. QF-1]